MHRSRIYRRGDVWYVDYDEPNGQRVRKRAGSREDAKAKLAEVIDDMGSGQYRYSRDTKLRFKDFKPEYLEYVKGKRNKYGAVRVWKRHVTSLVPLEVHFGEMLLSAIGDKEIDDYKKHRLAQTVKRRDVERGINPATINRDLAVLRNFFNVAKKRKKFFGDNPVNKEDHFLDEHPRQGRPLTRPEITRLLDSAKKESPQMSLAITIALCTGLRRAEVLGIKWANIDFDDRSIWIERTKGGKPHRAYMNKVVYDALKAYTRVGEYVFNSPSSRTGHLVEIKRRWTKVKEAAGLADILFHNLRTSVGTFQAERGVPAVGIQGTLGHASLKTTEDHYIKFLDEAGRQATAVLESLFDGEAKPQDTTGAQTINLRDLSRSFPTRKLGTA
jgi:integrase